MNCKALNEIATHFRYGKMPDKSKITDNGNYPVWSGYRYVGYYDEKNVIKNEIVVIARGVGGTGNVKICKEDCFLTNLSIAFNVNEDINPLYVYYYYQIKNLRYLDSGSAQSQITINDLKNVKIPIPNKPIQDKIVEVLNKLDQKIELNNEINNNLHELMKIKFNNCIDNLEEYEESVLSKIANYKNGLAMQKFRPIDESGLPVIKIKEMNSGITSETERCRSDIDSDVIIDNGDILFAWSGTLCMSIWCGGRAGLNQHIFKVTSDKYPKWFYYFWTLKHLDNFIEIAAGKATTMGHIKRTELDKSIVKIPNEKIMEKMDKIFTPMLNEYVNNSIESKKLLELRDTLLPKLMNGEINLDNIEI